MRPIPIETGISQTPLRVGLWKQGCHSTWGFGVGLQYHEMDPPPFLEHRVRFRQPMRRVFAFHP